MKSFSGRNRTRTLVLLALLVPALSFAGTRREILEKSLDRKGIQEIQLENINGHVSVEAIAGDHIEIEARKIARGSDAAEMLKELEVRIVVDGDRLIIDSKYPESHGWLGWLGLGSSCRCSVEYDLRIPADMDLDIESVNGAVEIEGLFGDVQVESVNGRVELEDVGGEVEVETVNGSINMNRSSLHSTAAATVNGSITITIPGTGGFEYHFDTVNGSIDSDFPIRVDGKWGPRSADGDVAGGGVELIAETINGDIELRKEDR